jgi:hypothetical protein
MPSRARWNTDSAGACCPRFAAHAEEGAFAVRALFQHLAVGVDLAAQLLRRPGQEQLGLDQILLEEGDDRLRAAGHVVRPARAHHDAIRVLRAQRGFAFGLRRGVAHVVDLVEDAQTRHLVGADLLKHLVGDFKLAFEAGSLASMTCSSSEASSASSSVDLNEATRPCGRFLMKPTVSLTSTRGTLSG